MTRAARLQVLAPVPGQDCATCPHHDHCHAPSLRAEAVVINLLVCRIERNIRRNTSTRQFLRRVRNKMWSFTRGFPDRDTAMSELTGAIIENLLTRYRMGMRAHPLLWLFGGKDSAAGRWRAETIRCEQRDRRYLLYPGDLNDDALVRLNRHSSNGWVTTGPPEAAVVPAEYDAQWPERLRVVILAGVLDDGATLTTREYRIFAFCWQQAREIGPNLYGVHEQLAQLLGIGRRQVSETYGRALRKLIHAAGAATRYYQQYGVDMPPRSSTAQFTPDDYPLLRRARDKHVPIADLALYYRVPDKKIRRTLQLVDACPPI